MSYRTSRVTPAIPPAPFPASPGEWRILYPHFQPEGIELLVSSKYNTKDSYLHFSDGSADGTRQSCHSLYDDGTYRHSEHVADRIVSHWEKVAGAPPVEKIRGWYSHYDVATQELVFMLEKSSNQYQASIRAQG